MIPGGHVKDGWECGPVVLAASAENRREQGSDDCLEELYFHLSALFKKKEGASYYFWRVGEWAFITCPFLITCQLSAVSSLCVRPHPPRRATGALAHWGPCDPKPDARLSVTLALSDGQTQSYPLVSWGSQHSSTWLFISRTARKTLSPRRRGLQRDPHLLHRISVQFRRSVLSDSLRPQQQQHARLPCPLPTSWACSNSGLWSRWW